jgi:hypothetical protein
VISISSSVGISFNNFDLVAWSKKIGLQGVGGLTKSVEIGSVHSFDSIASNIFGSRSIPWPRSGRVVPFSPVYNQAG